MRPTWRGAGGERALAGTAEDSKRAPILNDDDAAGKQAALRASGQSSSR